MHFAKIRKGSAIPEIHVDPTSALLVHQRLRLVGQGDAPPEAARAQRELNTLLRQDNASAVLRVKGGAKILPFPGRKMPLAQEVVIHEPGELIGTVSRLGGRDSTVPVLLLDESGLAYHCTTSRALAKELARQLFENPVRVAGHGKWRRNAESAWELEDFTITHWELLHTAPLADTVAALRAVQGSGWNALDDPQAALQALRQE